MELFLATDMFHWAANGPCKASEDHKQFSETVCTNGHDCKIFVLDYSQHGKQFMLSFWLHYCIFVEHNGLSYMQTEMMSDAIDDALDNDEAEDETDELTNQVGLLLLTFLS